MTTCLLVLSSHGFMAGSPGLVPVRFILIGRKYVCMLSTYENISDNITRPGLDQLYYL